MLKNSSIIAMFLIFTGISSFAQMPDSPALFLEKKFPAVYKITQTLSAIENTLDLSNAKDPRFLVVMSLPSTNEYQEVSDIRISAGKILQFVGKKEKYLRYTGKVPLENLTISYTLTINQFYPLWNKIRKLYPYDKTKPEYISYTLKNDERIQADNPIIEEAADRLYEDSKDVLDYIRRAYLWQQKTLSWKDTGSQKTIDEIFSNGGGECGSLSTVLISLLRNKGIPARYMKGFVLADGKGGSHTWSEFYLEGYGWAPIDPAFYSSTITDPVFLGYYNGKRFFYSRSNDYTIIDDNNNKQSIGSSGFASQYSIKGGSMPGVLKYDTETSYQTVSDPKESEFFNKPEFIRNTVTNAMAIINRQRELKNLQPFAVMPYLDKVAEKYLLPITGRDPLEASGIRYNSYGRWKMYYGFPTLMPAETLSHLFPWDRLEDPNMNNLGIGYRFEEGLHSFYFVLIKSNDVHLE